MAITSGDGHLAATYILIYSFLNQQSHTKAAEALKKAAKDIVVLKDGMKHDGPSLPDIFKQWQLLKKARDSSSSSEDDDSSDSDSDSSDDSSSSSDDSDSDTGSDSSSDNSDSGSTVKKTKVSVKAESKKSSKPPPPDPHSSSGSSSSDSEEETAKEAVQTPTAKKPSTKPSPVKKSPISPIPSPSSSSSSSSSDSEPDTVARPSTEISTNHKAKSQAPTSDSDSSSNDDPSSESGSSSSDDEKSKTQDVKDNKIAVPPCVPSTPAKGASPSRSSQTLSSVGKASDKASPTSGSSESDSDSNTSDSSASTKTKTNAKKAKAKNVKLPSPPVRKVERDKGQVVKRRKTSENGSSIPTATASNKDSTSVTNKNLQTGKPSRKVNHSFSRIKFDEIKFADERLKDNTFHSRGATTSDYGARAHQDLIVTRGAGFRKEKNKKKKGSYKGGDITMASHSIKFTD